LVFHICSVVLADEDKGIGDGFRLNMGGAFKFKVYFPSVIEAMQATNKKTPTGDPPELLVHST
jgi:hypothetical protein